MFKIVERNFGDVSIVRALDHVIKSEGQHLLLGYGFISESNSVVEIFKKIEEHLMLHECNTTTIIIGLFYNYRSPQTKAENLNKLKETFKNLLPDSLYEKGVSSRIHVVCCLDFHSKFCIKIKEDGKDNIATCGLLGSSNLSDSALNNRDRFELDFLLTGGEENKALQKLKEVAYQQLNKCYEIQISELGDEIHERIFSKPYFLNVIAPVLKEIEKQRQHEEFEDRKYYRDSAITQEDGVALHESDVAQGIASDMTR